MIVNYDCSFFVFRSVSLHNLSLSLSLMRRTVGFFGNLNFMLSNWPKSRPFWSKTYFYVALKRIQVDLFQGMCFMLNMFHISSNCSAVSEFYCAENKALMFFLILGMLSILPHVLLVHVKIIKKFPNLVRIWINDTHAVDISKLRAFKCAIRC